MEKQNLIDEILKTKSSEKLLALFKENPEFINLEFANDLKETYYKSWTTEPQKTQNAAKALSVLHKLLPEKEIEAIAKWVQGIAYLTEGKLEKTISELSKSSRIFESLDQYYQSAQTKVSQLYALALLGRYDEAVLIGNKALKIFKANKDFLATGKIEMNLGNIALRRTYYSEAAKYFLSARKTFNQINEKTWLTMCENNLAITYSGLNQFRKAEEFYANAFDNARLAKMFVTEAEIEASMGNLALFRGKYSDALRFLELSRRKYEELAMPHQTAIADLEIADIYLELNLADEALSIYERIAEEFKKLKMRGEEARTRANFGRAAILSGKTAQARNELKKAARLYEKEHNKTGAASVKIALANLEISHKNYKNALKSAGEAESLLTKSTNLRLKLAARFFKGESLAALGNFSEAEQILRKNYADALRQEQRNIAQSSLNSLGKIYLQRGELSRAQRLFKRSIKIIESLRAPLAGEEFRMSFLADKLAPFENLAKIYLAQNKFKQAFAMIENARARTLSENLQTESNPDSNEKNASKTTKKLAALREELNWFYSKLNRAEESEYAEILTEVKKREKQISDVLRQNESTKTIKTNEKFATEFDLENLQKSLGKNKVLLEFAKFDGRFAAFAVSGKKIFFVKDLATETEIIEILESLHFQFGALRYGAKIRGKYADELKKRADFYLGKLYEKLLAPLENFIENKDLIIVPADSLHYVPFQALKTGEKYLIETRLINYAPSANVWSLLQKKPRRNMQSALLIGFADERIPLVNSEIETLKNIFSNAKVFTGKAAKTSAFTENAPDFDVLHLACHGQFRPENPLFSSIHLADGNLTVRDICAKKINAELVTLSACETGLNKIFAGDEILGLARGFLIAGASSLVLSLWTVNDEATTELMKNFYTNLQRGETVAASLEKAQKVFIERGEHPYFWSPFAVIGK